MSFWPPFVILPHHILLYPQLKGRGSEVKDLVLPLSTVWDAMTQATQLHRGVSKACKALVGLQQLLHNHDTGAMLPKAKLGTAVSRWAARLPAA